MKEQQYERMCAINLPSDKLRNLQCCCKHSKFMGGILVGITSLKPIKKASNGSGMTITRISILENGYAAKIPSSGYLESQEQASQH